MPSQAWHSWVEVSALTSNDQKSVLLPASPDEAEKRASSRGSDANAPTTAAGPPPGMPLMPGPSP
jgi:hypothetical protein